jgi:hypothetical protein
MTPKEIQRARKARRLAKTRKVAQRGDLVALISYYFPRWVLPAILGYFVLALLVIFLFILLICLGLYLPIR